MVLELQKYSNEQKAKLNRVTAMKINRPQPKLKQTHMRSNSMMDTEFIQTEGKDIEIIYHENQK